MPAPAHPYGSAWGAERADAGIGPYILFQETYHKENYEKLHPTGPKHNYAYHTEAMDRAMEGGIDDVGLGVLYGLEMYRYEFCGQLMHAERLEAVHGVGRALKKPTTLTRRSLITASATKHSRKSAHLFVSPCRTPA